MRKETLNQIDKQIEENRQRAAMLSDKKCWLNGSKINTFKIHVINEAALSIEDLENVLTLAKTNFELIQLRELTEKHLPVQIKDNKK